MLGCFERALYPGVSRAVARLAPDLCIASGQGCCGALHAHNGELERGRELARELGSSLRGVIVTTAGGCAAHLVAELGRDRVLELSEWLVTAEGAPAVTGFMQSSMRVAFQDSCHLRNGLGTYEEPRSILARVAEYVEIPSSSVCCGAAGTYSILRPNDSRAILARKLDEIEAAGVDAVVVVNPGCHRQLEAGLRKRRSRTRVMHLAEVLDARRRAPA